MRELLNYIASLFYVQGLKHGQTNEDLSKLPDLRDCAQISSQKQTNNII